MTRAEPPAQDIEKRRTTRLVLIIGTVLSLLCVPLAGFWGVMTIMASDAGSTPAIDVYIAVNMALPLVMIVAPILAWIAFAMRRYQLAILFLLIPIPWAIVAFGLIFTL